MKKLIYLIVLTLILGLFLTGCLLSNVGQVPTTEQSGISYLTKGLPSGLVGLWHFDEGEGNFACDNSMYGNNGTLINGPQWVYAKFGQALSFNGVDEYVEIASDLSIMPATLTVEAWIQPGKTGVKQNILGKWDGGGDASYLFQLTLDNKFKFYLHNKTTTEGITGITTVTIGNWYHVVGTYDGSEANLYVNGNLEAGPTMLVAPMTDSNVPLRIGATAGAPSLYPIISPFKGLVDEVRIWNTALTADQLNFYGFNGLLAPYKKPPRAFKIGSSIPLKWQYTDLAGIVVDSSLAIPRVRIVSTGDAPPEVTGEPIIVDDPGKSGLRYDSTTDMWIFNWQTKVFAPGTYDIYITSFQTGQANGPFEIQLKQ